MPYRACPAGAPRRGQALWGDFDPRSHGRDRRFEPLSCGNRIGRRERDLTFATSVDDESHLDVRKELMHRQAVKSELECDSREDSSISIDDRPSLVVTHGHLIRPATLEHVDPAGNVEARDTDRN